MKHLTINILMMSFWPNIPHRSTENDLLGSDSSLPLFWPHQSLLSQETQPATTGRRWNRMRLMYIQSTVYMNQEFLQPYTRRRARLMETHSTWVVLSLTQRQYGARQHDHMYNTALCPVPIFALLHSPASDPHT